MKLTFVMTYCDRDAVLAQQSAAALRNLYPDAAVVLIEDKPRLKLSQFGGQWTERVFTQGLATNPEVLVKVDPDTRAMRAASFPTTDIFGQMAPIGTYFPKSEGIILGGAIGFQGAAVEKILNSGLLLDTKYQQKPYACEERRFGTPREMIALQDPIVADIAQRLGLSQGDWPGLHLKLSWEPSVPVPADATFAHPVKA